MDILVVALPDLPAHLREMLEEEISDLVAAFLEDAEAGILDALD